MELIGIPALWRSGSRAAPGPVDPQLHWPRTLLSEPRLHLQQPAHARVQEVHDRNWVKVVQRIPMRVYVDTADMNLPPLHAGMSVEVEVHMGQRRGAPFFAGTHSETRGDK